MWLARLLAYAGIGWTMANIGHPYNTTEFWCVLGMVWAVERTTEMIVINDIRATYNKLLDEEEKSRK